jgi:hypothetical protein
MDVTTGGHEVGWLGGSCRWWWVRHRHEGLGPIMTAVLLFIGIPLFILGLALMQSAEQR